MLRLRSHRADVVLVGVSLLLRRGPRFDTASTAVVAHACFGDIGHRRVVGVVNYGGVYVSDICVVGKVTTFPATPFITDTAVAEAVIDATVEANLRPPISFMENECTSAPAPIPRGPKEADLWRFYPCTRHPVISILIVISPVAGSPQVALGRADWLHVNGKCRRAEANGNADSDLSRCTVR